MKPRNLLTSLGISLMVCGGLTLLLPSVTRAESSRYVINGSEVYDTETKLTWQRCSVGLRWIKGHGCNKAAKKQFTFEDALKLAHGNWRVPEKDELASLIDKSKSPTIDLDAFPDMKDGVNWYWSSTPNNDEITSSWGVFFSDGLVFYYLRRDALAVRLVRSGQ